MNRKFLIPTMAAIMLSSANSAPAAAQNDALAPAEGPCEMELSVDNSVDWRGPYGRGYEVFGNDESFETVNISVRKEGQPCDFFLTATANGAGGQASLEGPDSRLSFDVLKTTNGPSFLSSDLFGSQLSRIEGKFGSGRGGYSGALFVSIPTGQFVRGGKFTGQALIRLFRDGVNGPELVSEAPLAILAPVASVLEVRSDLFPEGVRETGIDLGDLSVASRRNVDFEISSNADISLTFQSANNGKLAHNAGGPGINYNLMLRGEQLDLAGQPATHQLAYSGNNQSQSVPLEISVPAPHGLPAAGQYNDTLTVTFTAE